MERSRMSRRFYYPGSLEAETVRLEGPEAHHLVHVLRAEAGQQVFLFDGAGTEALAEVLGVSRKTADLRICRTIGASEPESGLVLATAVPKGERFRWLVEKATELGVERLVPLHTTRSTVDPRENKLDKLRQTVIEACKQCGRNRLMEIEAPVEWADLLAREATLRPCFVSQPAGEPVSGVTAFAGTPAPLVAIGPEGGFTEDEIQQGLAAGARLVSLGPRILRIETAAIAVAALRAVTVVHIA